MRLSSRFSLLAVAASSLLVQPLHAQYGRGRSGFWLRVGAGYGSANVSCNECSIGPRMDGVAASLEMGGTLNRYVRLGGFIDGWTHGSGDAAETMSTVGASLYYYPAPRGPFFIKGGLGFSAYHAAGFAAYDNFGNFVGSSAISGTGWGFVTGAGFEIPIGRSVALVPFVDYSWGGVGSLSYDDGTPFATGWNQNFASMGVSLSFSPRGQRGRRWH